MHQNRSMLVPKECFLGRRLSFEFLLCWRGGMPPFHALSFALRIIVMHPCLVAGDSSFQDTGIFFIPFKKLGHNLHALSLLHNSKLLGNPPCADFAVSQIITQYGICGSNADIQMCSHFRHRYPSVFSNHGIDCRCGLVCAMLMTDQNDLHQ